MTKGSTGTELAKVPSDQPYIWSSLPDGQRSGLGMQLNWGPQQSGSVQQGSFALHQKKLDKLPKGLLDEISYCKKNYGCYAHYDDQGELKIGCRDKIYL